MKALRIVLICLLFALLCGPLLSCHSDREYDALQRQNEELEAKLASAREHIEDAESHLDDLKSNVADAESEASNYPVCQVCCKPNVLRVTWDKSAGEYTISAELE